jgi:hypothetical protein
MSTKALQKYDPKQLQTLDEVAQQALVVSAAARGGLEAACVIGAAMAQLKDELTDETVSKLFIPLQNSQLGFRTDNPAGYPVATVKECVIEAALRGIRPVGNQFNIIQSRCYITKEGYEYKLKNLDGLTGLKVDLGVPKIHASGEGAIVECKATWNYKGTADAKTSEIPVRMNKGMGADAVLGKAQRKFLKRIFEQITGCAEPDGDVDDAIAAAKPAQATETPKPNFGNATQQTINV